MLQKLNYAVQEVLYDSWLHCEYNWQGNGRQK